jgi:hypothetical protein
MRRHRRSSSFHEKASQPLLRAPEACDAAMASSQYAAQSP